MQPARTIVALVVGGALTACGAPPAPPAGEPGAALPSLTAKDDLSPWREVLGFAGSGEVFAKDGVLTLGQGEALTGVVWNGESYPFPLVDYEITLKARRTRGSDILCALTFPYKDPKTCATLIVGGWGGGLVGISSISELDASENETTAYAKLKNDTWYEIRLTVRDDHLSAHIDGAIVINYPLNGQPLSLRPGEIDLCVPLGLASFASRSEIKEMVIRPITPGSQTP